MLSDVELTGTALSSARELLPMEINLAKDVESRVSRPRTIEHDFWPLEEVDPKKARFPCCVVWTPLPIVSWLAPFIGHVGICKEDGTIIDFSGSNLINVNDFAFGPVARYLQLDREQCCFPPNLAEHRCKQRYVHAEFGTAMTWDDAIQTSGRHIENRSYNIFTCNCHSFVADCLNRVSYEGSMSWNMVNVAALVLAQGRWVNGLSVLRSFMPFLAVLCMGLYAVGWPFVIALLSFSFLLLVWFLLSNYVFKNMSDC
ncbi:protein REVERSION-TO-ETHYLENE SENSITIVITY1-like [Salvia splendens]|uniref:protein REVERSION-TO-ETHYLENE SENSITIVITY1-like n=1 Tax=Salvia splendens TaxID=180675 RepID=UPI00110366F9|nr:protein REVERSION-TO-ETHYLENE SENSITIVITY1-like [Salvia splendens]XP_042068055.1 protein REVERSION-TO-ETHYLENE SENSITIVITY1-like [Salvia splendens]